ncbi:MAG: hypothetical protein V1900_02735 [Candidatus Aenigmatarchaeota archaeon]
MNVNTNYLSLMRLMSPAYSFYVEMMRRQNNVYYKKHFMKQIAANEWLDRSELEEIQAEKLKRLVSHSYNTIPFYRKLMNRNKVSPDDIKTIDDIAKLPVIKKKDFKMHKFNDLVSKNVRRSDTITIKSSGSTGSPSKSLQTKESLFKQYSYIVLRRFGWAGISSRDREICMGNREITPTITKFEVNPNSMFLPHFFFDEKKCAEFMRMFFAFKPDYIRSYPQALAQIGRFAMDNEMDVQIKAALVGGNMLTDNDRKTIENAFDTEIFESYMASECGLIASECEMHNMHTYMDRVILETVDENGEDINGSPGSVLVTNLDNFAMPYIRYELGDMAKLGRGKCKCGRSMQIIDELHGRSVDVIVTPEKKYVHLPYFMSLFGEYQEIMNFRLVQKDFDKVSVYIYVKDSLPQARIESLSNRLNKALDGMRVEINAVKNEPEIHTYRKFKYIENLVKDRI